MNYNKTLFAGRFVRTPEVKTTAGGGSITKFTLATNRKWKDASGKLNDEATFADVVAFGTLAENIGRFFAKGDNIFIEGRLKQNVWKDREGNDRKQLEIVAESFQFCVSEPKERQEERPPQRQTRQPERVQDSLLEPSTNEDDFIPF